MTDQQNQPSSPLTVPRGTSRRWWKALLLGLAILLCGAVIGSALTLIVAHRIVVHAIDNPHEAPTRIANRMKRKLDLSEEQRAKVLEILTERQRAIHAIRSEAQPKVVHELNLAKEQVAAVLNEKQARSWRERFDSLRRRWLPWLAPSWAPPPGHR